MKKEKLKMKDGTILELIPGEGGDPRMAYVRVEITSESQVMSLDNDDMKTLKKVRSWVEQIINANS